MVKGAPKIRMALRIVFSYQCPFRLHLRASTFSHLNHRQTVIHGRQVSFTVLLTSLRPIRPRLVAPYRGLFRLRHRRRPPKRAKPCTTVFFFPMSIPRHHPRLRLLLPTRQICRNGASNVFLQSNKLPTFAHRVRSRLFPSFVTAIFQPSLPRNINGTNFVGRQCTFMTFVTKHRTRREIHLNVIYLTYHREDERLRELFRTSQRNVQVVVRIKVVQRATSLFQHQTSFFFPFSKRLRLYFMVTSYAGTNVNIGGTRVPFHLQRQAIQRNGEGRSFGTPSTQSCGQDRYLQGSHHPIPCNDHLHVVSRITSARRRRSYVNDRASPLVVPLRHGTGRGCECLFYYGTFCPKDRVEGILPRNNRQLPTVFHFRNIRSGT